MSGRQAIDSWQRKEPVDNCPFVVASGSKDQKYVELFLLDVKSSLARQTRL